MAHDVHIIGGGLAGLFWAWGADEDVLQRLVKKTLYIGTFAFIIGNFALLAGISPREVQDWYLVVYADAYEWVEAPNTIGMSQFADGGMIASKPYVSSGNYIDKMSNYCDGCAYDVRKKTGKGACPFNLLYWWFLDRHAQRFRKNPRMGTIYATWDRMDTDRKKVILSEAEEFLARLDNGETP